ncbi:hypothetical protein GQ44DRAFT_604947 [Phaeosphaeriaceae sp. PMI808]|nr:hypothetical protein GQ44DRAFT_604947 [Phaeosphaeriaceae sp. PMI808]
MSASTDHMLQQSNLRLSNFARFADKLKDSMTTKRAPPPGQIQRPLSQLSVEDPNHHYNYLIHNRRSSSTRYTEKMMQMFTHSSRPGSILMTVIINDLPVEILQNVFLHLDAFTLIRIRRVCKLWRDLIPGDSPILSEALFLKPSHNLHAYSFTLATFDFDLEINTRLPYGGNPDLRIQTTFIDGLSMTRRCLGLIRTSSEIIFHPIIMDFNAYVQGDEFGKSKLNVHGEPATDPINWRNMLVSMPPLTELRINQTIGKKHTTVRILQAKDGVKLGDVFDYLITWRRQDLVSS